MNTHEGFVMDCNAMSKKLGSLTTYLKNQL